MVLPEGHHVLAESYSCISLPLSFEVCPAPCGRGTMPVEEREN